MASGKREEINPNRDEEEMVEGQGSEPEEQNLDFNPNNNHISNTTSNNSNNSNINNNNSADDGNIAGSIMPEETYCIKEVPGWRLHVVTNLYRMEGTELSAGLANMLQNIEDEEYRRRHAKPEAEERRRKRWDLQQMREQELLERQRKRQQAELPVHMQPTPYVNSFYPNPEEITHIEVTRDIPVMMFGRPLPKITQQDFELPWKVPARHSARLGGQRRK